MKQRSLSLLFFAFCFGLSTVVTTNGQGIGDPNRGAETGRYNISGKVYRPDGRPAIGVRVEISGTDFINLSSSTDQDGSFMFGGVPGGNYTVLTKSNEFQNDTQSFSIERAVPGQTFKLFLNLRDSPNAILSSPLLTGVPPAAVAKLQKGIAAKDRKAAVGFYDEAIAAYPNFAVAWFQKGTAYLQLNELDKALEAFVKAIQIKPDYLEAKYQYAYTQFLRKNYEIATAAFDDVIKQKLEMPEAHMYLGISLYHLGNMKDAENQLKLALAAPGAERLALAHRYLGGVYMETKQNAVAAQELQKYLDLTPKAPDAGKIRDTIATLKKQS
jgi:Tfp pilus assembly protein PilF